MNFLTVLGLIIFSYWFTLRATLVEYLQESGIPAAKDWRTEGAVTNIKNQKNCNSCWAFGVVSASYFIFLLLYYLT